MKAKRRRISIERSKLEGEELPDGLIERRAA